MTAYTPTITLEVNGVAYSGLVDYSFTTTSGGSSLDEMPQPGVINASILGDWDYGFDINIGDTINLKAGAIGDVAMGVVTDLAITAQSGTVGNVTRLDFTAMGALNYLVNATWYCEGLTSVTTKAAIEALMASAGFTSWEEVNPTLTWDDIDPTVTWATYEPVASNLLNGYTVSGANGGTVTIPAGYRSVWEDLSTLVLGSHGMVYETTYGVIAIQVAPTATLYADVTLTDSMINRDIVATSSKSDVRNIIEVAYNSGTYTTSDAVSVYLYGENSGTLQTLLDNSLDAANLGEYLLESRAYPRLGISQLTVDLANPILTNTDRSNLLYSPSPYGSAITTSGIPAAFNGDNRYLIAGHSTQISKDWVSKTLNLVTYESFFTSPTWLQISPSYTWTSYGTAYPTQKWSDL